MKTNRKHLVAACALAAVFTFAAAPPCVATPSPYVEPSFWMADPLRPDATWWRDTANQNALAQYWQDQCLGTVLHPYSSPDGTLDVYVYSAKTWDENVVLITTSTSYILVGLGDSDANANAAKAAFNEVIPGFANRQLVGVVFADGPLDLRDAWGGQAWGPTAQDSNYQYQVLYTPGTWPADGCAKGTPVPVYVNAGWNDFMQDESHDLEAEAVRVQEVYGSLLSTGPDGYLGLESSWPTTEPSVISPTVEVPADVSSPEIDQNGNPVTLNCLNITLYDHAVKHVVQLYPVLNNSDPTLLVWLPEYGVLIAGAPFQPCFPGFGSLTGRPLSPTEMISAYNEMLSLQRGTFTTDPTTGQLTETLNGAAAQFLLYLHGLPVIGPEAVSQNLTNVKGALNYVWSETLREVNFEMPLDYIVQHVVIPEPFASSPFVAPYLTDVPTAVKNVYDYYLGWFHDDPLQLTSTLTSADKAQLIANLAGGVEPLIVQAKNAELAADATQSTGSTGLSSAEQALFLAQTAYHAAAAAYGAGGGNLRDLDEAVAIYAQALTKCAYQEQSSQIRNYYLTLANQLVSGQ